MNRPQFLRRAAKQSRRTGSLLFLLVALVLVTLPFWNSLQDVMTRLVMSVGWYRTIQDIVVPYELRVIATILILLHFPIKVGGAFIEWTKPTGGTDAIYLIWNCVGWQTLVLFGVTLITGLSGKYTWMTKFETFLLGVLGTYIINITRLVLVIVVYYFAGRGIGGVFHDYFSSLMTLSWLFGFWWFALNFILEEKEIPVAHQTPEIEVV